MSSNKSRLMLREKLRIDRPEMSEEELDSFLHVVSQRYINQAVLLAVKKGVLQKRTQCSICPNSVMSGTTKRVAAHMMITRSPSPFAGYASNVTPLGTDTTIPHHCHFTFKGFHDQTILG